MPHAAGVSERPPDESIEPGALYVVATPIGNLADLSARARAVLGRVHTVYAEDTRVTGGLLARFALHVRLRACHDHNEEATVADILAQLGRGEAVALVSDAGTPLLSDPGLLIVRAAHGAGHPVRVVPGPCAMVAALSGAGLPVVGFCFEGFLPTRGAARRALLAEQAAVPRTHVYYEAPHRIVETVDDLIATFGAARPACLGRELTKRHETLLLGTLDDLRTYLAAHPDHRRGEFVLVVGGAAPAEAAAPTVDVERLLGALLARLPLTEAVATAAEATGLPRNRLYRAALALQERG